MERGMFKVFKPGEKRRTTFTQNVKADLSFLPSLLPRIYTLKVRSSSHILAFSGWLSSWSLQRWWF